MKKLLSLGLAAMLAFGLATTSFAADDTSSSEPSSTPATFTLDKEYDLAGAGTSPEEIFHLKEIGTPTETSTGVTNIPDFTKDNNGYVANVTFESGAAGDAAKNKQTFSADWPEYTEVGVYNYTFQEVAGDTAGVTYYGKTLYVTVYVVNNAEGGVTVEGYTVRPDNNDKQTAKIEEITNTYSAGELDVKKTVEGNMGNKNQYFTFTVTLTAPEGTTVKSTIGLNSGDLTSKDNPETITFDEKGTATATIYLKDNETFKFTNIPDGVTYVVEEAAVDDYVSTVDEDGAAATGTIDTTTKTVHYINTKDQGIDMGVTLNNMPYILVLAVLAAGVAVFVIRKRRED